MDDRNFSVSVVIPAYNGAATIGRAIDSVLAQTRPPEQIIVVDDGSTDRTAAAVSEYGGRIDAVRQSNAGPGAARNRGIQEAKYPWIAFLDADDEWLPDRLERQIRILEANPDLRWVMGNFIRCQCGLEVRKADQSPDQLHRVFQRGRTHSSFFQVFQRGVSIHPNTMLIRREAFDAAGGFEEGIRKTEDLDMWFRIAYRWPTMGYCSEPIAIYHMGIQGSLLQRVDPDDGEVFGGFLSRNLRLAREHGKAAEFGPCASLLLRKWIRGLLFAGLGRPARRLSREFGDLLEWHFRAFVRAAALCPGLTAAVLRGASRLARTIGLRRGPTRRG
jgi:glycosyltransferase involved in cell wall biosynthesis